MEIQYSKKLRESAKTWKNRCVITMQAHKMVNSIITKCNTGEKAKNNCMRTLIIWKDRKKKKKHEIMLQNDNLVTCK